MKRIKMLAAMVLLVIPVLFLGCNLDVEEEQNVYYVSTQGNDESPGTFDEPWRTIQKASENMVAGDTVYLREGVYNEAVTVSTSGEVDNYITISNYQDETVVVDGEGIDWGYNWSSLFDINTQSYLRIEGIRVINSRWAGFGSTTDDKGSSYVEILNCSTYNTQASGIIFMNAENIIIEGNSIERASINTSGSQEGISLDNVDYFEIKNNKVFNFTNDVPGRGGEAIDAKNGSSYGKIYGNEVYNIPKIGIYIDSYEGEQKDIEVYDNIIYSCGQGITLANEKGGYLRDVVVRNNDISYCSWGLAIGGWNDGYSHEMENISFVDNKLTGISRSGIYLNNPDAINVVIKGNQIQGTSSYVPIRLNGGNLSETVIDGNYFDRISGDHPVGTNYNMLE
ncbi:right-handed parallel beta-helix repeat-containing protein [Alkalibacter saccharofermentans]|uniref:Right handed beta helix region n=1 Tax=Alkalibacter saccharofermentans DSM 14828 TaxID=1120975 RepID=A0A1M4ZH47_9FIRM|nr:right-handed parallel beta-helix repeat-containing protein [Alkalibacter saccharofermentans]SHF17359.1 Right handed beta helix region [Alkalibacter saccharofermentans DSM 14828]